MTFILRFVYTKSMFLLVFTVTGSIMLHKSLYTYIFFRLLNIFNYRFSEITAL